MATAFRITKGSDAVANHRTTLGSSLVAFGLLCFLGPIGAGDEKPLTSPATDEEIAALVRDLGDQSYEKRVFATRRLCAIGVKAKGALMSASESGDMETALRARQLLDVLDRLWFAGAEVSLTFSKTRIAWDEPVDLLLTMRNRSQYAVRIPFQIDPGERASQSSDALQVGDMLDVADLLRVQDSNGRRVELRVDDILADEAVASAVQVRLNAGPVSIVEPEKTIALTVRLFNRGWARYPLLDEGTYTAVLDYVPDWQDEALAGERVGRITSNKATLAVTKSAPEAVSRGGGVASLKLTREGDRLVARLLNRTDQAMVVNKNYGASPPFAEGRWVYSLNGTLLEIPIVPMPGASWHDFAAGGLAEVRPGLDTEIAQISIIELHDLLAESGADLSSDRWTVHFAYSNLCDRKWQARQGSALLGNEKAPAIFQKPLPRLILSARHASNALAAPKPE